ncbi:hypothetical protein M7963_18705 [Enterobacter roggenkampii]|uniref:hypothetical protein n=1 Tax=Enterobacter roggenkampii TaxID=1812935 RepID=UPI002236F31F|nr:hypothetical protein [Enterobacter roggenkampii]MCW5003547.1 hypothetical protein [Enterobacter roggenkampii]
MGIFIGAGFSGGGPQGQPPAITGTPAQVTVTREQGRLVLSTPQDLATDSSPVFRGIQLQGPQEWSGNDVVTVDYVLNAVTGIASKGMVSAVMVEDLPLTGEAVADGVRLRAGDKVLRACSTRPWLNGIYDVRSDAWQRSENSNTWEKMTGALVTVKSGDTFGGKRWACMAEAGGTLDADAAEWLMLNAADGMTEAPLDGELYARRNGGWESIINYPAEVNGSYRILGKSEGRQIRRYFFTGKMPTNSVPMTLASGIRYVLNNGLKIARPQGAANIQWHAVENIPQDGEHISALFIRDDTLQLYVLSSSPWAGREYTGYVEVMLN